MFKSDKPIESSKDDLLGTKAFAQSLCDAILSYKEIDSLSIGMYGPWGSGKTSIINMVIERIEEQTHSKNNKPIIIKFYPWNYSDQNQLTSQFFKQLSLSINKKDYGKDASKIGKKLSFYSKLVSPLVYVPQISVFALLLSKIIKSVGKASESFGKTDNKSLEEIKNELNTLLAKQNRKIIVIIDDIDRLNNTEIRQIFQLVKSIGDFQNTVYILAFDKEVIINALSKVQEGSGAGYLEKVIQIPFEFPAISKEKIEEYLFSQLSIILKDIPEKHFDKTYWDNIYNSGLKYLFINIRDVTRYLNVLQFSFQMVKNEVNPIDFFAITGIQVFIPSLYYAIRKNKEMFSGSIDNYSKYGKSDNLKKEIESLCTELFKSIPNLKKEVIKDFLKTIFPKLEAVFSNTHYYSNWQGDWRKKCRICSPDVFDIYFKLTLPIENISRIKMEQTLSLANNITNFKNELLNLRDTNLITSFLNRMEDCTGEDIPFENIENIVTVLMDIGDKFSNNEDDGFFTMDTPSRLLRIFNKLSNRFNSRDKRFEIFKKAMTNAGESLFTVVHETSFQSQQHSKNTSNGNLEPIDKTIVTEAQLTVLKKIACDKIKLWAEDNRLKEHENLINILYNWKKWSNENDVKSYVLNITENDDDLVSFLKKFLSEINIQSISDYVIKSEWQMDLKKIDDNYISLKDIEPRIRKIFQSEIFKNYKEKEQLAIRTFLDTFDGKIKNKF
jgi:predicted KAP-like P-loop ATPase